MRQWTHKRRCRGESGDAVSARRHQSRHLPFAPIKLQVLLAQCTQPETALPHSIKQAFLEPPEAMTSCKSINIIVKSPSLRAGHCGAELLLGSRRMDDVALVIPDEGLGVVLSCSRPGWRARINLLIRYYYRYDQSLLMSSLILKLISDRLLNASCLTHIFWFP